MNRVPKLLSAFALTVACAVTSAFAQLPAGDYDLYTFDEFGHGSFQVAGTGPLPLFIQNLPGAVAQDPFSGLFTLRYNVSAAMLPGDVLIYDKGPVNVLSDIIRFDGQGHLFFFSQLQPGETPTLADVPTLPSTLTGVNDVGLFETQFPFGGVGVTYVPLPARQQPGSDTFPDQFVIITSTPEPATAFLLLLGTGLFLIRRLSQSKIASQKSKIPSTPSPSSATC